MGRGWQKRRGEATWKMMRYWNNGGGGGDGTLQFARERPAGKRLCRILYPTWSRAAVGLPLACATRLGYRRQNSGGEAVVALPVLAHPRPPAEALLLALSRK